jgi:hypothetical protein
MEGWNNSQLEYFIEVPKDSGPLYFIVETYYQNIIPNECTTGTLDFSSGDSVSLSSPLLDLEIYLNDSPSFSDYRLVSDQFSYPILITDYQGGDTFKIVVSYTWFDSPAKDYTLSVYSKQELEIRDQEGEMSVLHMDGQEPSGFTHSGYRVLVPEEPVDLEIKTLEDVFISALGTESFIWGVIVLCFTKHPLICFNPINWF